MSGRNNHIDQHVIAGLQSQQIREMQQADEVRFLRANHMEIMRTVYLGMVDKDADCFDYPGKSDHVLDDCAKIAKNIADRFMIANGFMQEPAKP